MSGITEVINLSYWLLMIVVPCRVKDITTAIIWLIMTFLVRTEKCENLICLMHIISCRFQCVILQVLRKYFLLHSEKKY